MIPSLSDLYGRHRELFLYAVIGASGAALDLLAYLVLSGMLGVDPVLATVLSVSIGIVNNFLLNSFINFLVRTRLWLRFLSFYAIGLFGVGLSALIIWVFTDLIDIGFFWAKVVSIPPTVIGQYIANKYITFAQRAAQREDRDVRAE